MVMVVLSFELVRVAVVTEGGVDEADVVGTVCEDDVVGIDDVDDGVVVVSDREEVVDMGVVDVLDSEVDELDIDTGVELD